MHVSGRLVVAMVLAAVAVGMPLRAADTGTVSGAVFDQSGAPMAGVAVTISGDQLPIGRTAETSANGVYRFEYLLPGEYVVAIEKPGVGSARRAAIVELGKDTQIDLVLGLTVKEELTVVGVQPAVDVRSTEVGFNFTSSVFNSVPIDRTYRGLFQLIPGVADNRSAIGPAAGGSRQDNTYLIDGANITSPGFGYLSTEVNQLDIAEVNLKRAGISAEFGRTSGTVTNAVSRSGSNRFAGIGRIDWLSKNLVGSYDSTFRDPVLTTEIGPAIGLGGPILRNHLFFYGSARYSSESKWDRVNKSSVALPDEIRTASEFFGKLTATPSPGQLLNVSYRHRPNHVDNAGIGSDFAPSAASTTDNSSRIGSAEWTSFFTSRRSVNLRYLYLKENNEDVPVTALGYQPPFNPGNLIAMGQYMDPAQANVTTGGSQYTNIQDYRRHEVRGIVSQLFDIGPSSHTLKVGGGFELAEEMLNRSANGWGLIANVSVDGVPALRTRYYTPQPAQLGQGRTSSIFVQDDVTIGNRTSINAGLLLNRDEFSQNVAGSGGCPPTVLKGGAAVYESDGDRCTFLRFGFGSEIQPRVGVSVQLRQGKGDKAYANWGRYYNMDQKSSGRSLAPNRIFQTQTVFDLNGNVLSSGPLASTTGKLIDPAIKPIYTDEILIGYATPIGGTFSVDAFFMSRTMNNVIEDVPSRQNGTAPDSGPFVATNLPCVAFVACQNADASRTYRAFTIDIRRQLSSGWMSAISYTWSRYEGNFDLDYSTVAVFNTSSFIQDGPGTNVQDPNRFGPLFEDRPHVLKMFGSYNVTRRLTASGYLRVQSGTPWAARARDWEGGVLNYLEPAGSHRNPTWTNLDLMASYRLPIEGRARVSLEARVLNVFDNQTRLSTDSQQFLDLRTQPTAPFFAPYQQPNPFFGAGNAFAPPRRLSLAAVATF